MLNKSNRGCKQRIGSVKRRTNPDVSEDISTPANGETIKETMLSEMRASRYIFVKTMARLSIFRRYFYICNNIFTTSSNQRLGECVRPKMESQVVAKEQGCWQTMPFNKPQMVR